MPYHSSEMRDVFWYDILNIFIIFLVAHISGHNHDKNCHVDQSMPFIYVHMHSPFNDIKFNLDWIEMID